MAYEEEEARRSRVVVNTPTSQREVVRSEAVRHPERQGISGGVLAAIVVGVVALAAIAVLFLMNRQQQQDANANLASQPPQTTIVQQPAQQPPVIVQQPGAATQPAPVIVNNPGAPASGGTATSGAPDDSSIQAAIDKKLGNDPNLSSLGIYVTVANGKATITGTVRSEAVKAQVERAVRSVKGVKSVDNQIIIG